MSDRCGCMGTVLVVTTIAACAVPECASGQTGPDASPLRDVIISSGDQSLRVRLWVTVDDEPIADRFLRTRIAYVERLFEQLDRNDDSQLSPDEAAHTPAPEIELPESVLAGETENVNVAFNFRAVDGNNDGHVTSEELLDFYRYFGDGPVRVDRSRNPEAGDLQLHSAVQRRLDENGDGRLSLDELSGAARLGALDRDGNEVLDPSELIGPGGIGTSVAAASGEDDDFRVRTASPGSLPADLHVIIRYSGNPDSHPLPEIIVESDSASLSPGDQKAGIRVLQFDDLAAELHATCGPMRVLQRSRRVLALEFRGADADGDGIVQSTDRLPGFLEQMFPVLDADGDDAVSKVELNRFTEELLPLESGTLDSRVLLQIDLPRVGLFALLDTDHDGRLGRRELSSARNRFELLDRNANRFLDESELRSALRISIQRGSLTAPYATDRTRGSGPVWFVRMDRNRDGDLSSSEFLGSQQAFRQLDLDGDGLIGLPEALQVDSDGGQFLESGE